MKNVTKKEKDALVRMMIYLKFELIRLGLEEDAVFFNQFIKKIEKELDEV